MTHASSAFDDFGDTKRVELLAKEHLPLLKDFHAYLRQQDVTFFLADQIKRLLDTFLSEHADPKQPGHAAVQKLYRGCQEIIVSGLFTYALLRPKIGVKRLVRMHRDADGFESVSRNHYLQMKDALVQGAEISARPGLVIDFSPFYREYPVVRESGDMGDGISLLNRHLSARLYQNPVEFQSAILKFLQTCEIDSTNLLVNNHLQSPSILLEELDAARDLLADRDRDMPYEDFAHELRVHGFEPGWGTTASTIAETLGLLARVLASSDPTLFAEFVGRLPLMNKVLMVSPHGWFAQEGVLGRPDTGGQVTYVLDQARALERRMKDHFRECGVDTVPYIAILTRLIPDDDGTTCGMPREKVLGSDNCWIIRVPFRYESGEVIPHWISRFRIWPYLDRFCEEAREVVMREFMGRPDLIVGHYSDGNLVAHRLAQDLRTTHCAAVHALEKSKYLFSDLQWASMESDYHFSCQFTADILAYNAAEYIICSSYREIGGTETDMGMFESYETFSMPGLYRVKSGLDPKLARYNIVPPGASEDYFYPHTETSRRLTVVTHSLEELLFSPDPAEGCYGHLAEPNRPPILAMSRVDKVKNLPGLVELYGKSETLRRLANLIIVSSITDASQSEDVEEIEQIQRIYDLINQYDLVGQIRWVGARLSKVETGEIYRTISDRRGVFAQPAFMETFGLTVIEAMACGTPVVVTSFGGPSEIVLPGECGEVQDPNDHAAFAAALERVLAHPDVWDRYSQAGIKRVSDAFSWTQHARKILRLANLYTFWNSLDAMNWASLDQYIHTLYSTVYRPRAASVG